jgi:hypothetical protein
MTRFKVDHLEPTGTIEHTMRGIVLAPSVDPHAVVLILKHAGKANERYQKALKNALARGQLDERATIKIFAATVCEGWKHVYDAEGKPVPYSPEDLEQLLGDLLDKNRHDAVSAAIDRASDPHPFTARDDLGKG